MDAETKADCFVRHRCNLTACVNVHAAWDPDGNLVPVFAVEIPISRPAGSPPTAR